MAIMLLKVQVNMLLNLLLCIFSKFVKVLLDQFYRKFRGYGVKALDSLYNCKGAN